MTTKMVFRKIPAKDAVYQMGETDSYSGFETCKNTPPYWVKLTNDFFLGVFPVTQAQHYKLRKDRGNKCTNETLYVDRDYYPVAGIPYADLRGWYTGSTDSWPGSGHTVPSWSVPGAMSKLTGLTIDIPTEAQWEFAARGGVYDKALYSGKSFSQDAVDELGWYGLNSDSAMHPVNTKLPNAFGLYSLFGNCYEWTLNAWGWPSDTTGYTQDDPCVEPIGTNSKYRVARGQPYTYQFKGMSIALRSGIDYGSYGYCTGFRLWFVAE